MYLLKSGAFKVWQSTAGNITLACCCISATAGGNKTTARCEFSVQERRGKVLGETRGAHVRRQIYHATLTMVRLSVAPAWPGLIVQGTIHLELLIRSTCDIERVIFIGHRIPRPWFRRGTCSSSAITSAACRRPSSARRPSTHRPLQTRRPRPCSSSTLPPTLPSSHSPWNSVARHSMRVKLAGCFKFIPQQNRFWILDKPLLDFSYFSTWNYEW